MGGGCRRRLLLSDTTLRQRTSGLRPRSGGRNRKHEKVPTNRLRNSLWGQVDQSGATSPTPEAQLRPKTLPQVGVTPPRGTVGAGGLRSRPRPRGTSPPPATPRHGRQSGARAGVTALLLLTDLNALLPQAGGGRRSQRECRRPWAPSRCPARSWAGGGGRTGRGVTRWTRCARCGARAPSPSPRDALRLTERGLARSRRWRWASRSARRRTCCGRWRSCRCGRGTAGVRSPEWADAMTRTRRRSSWWPRRGPSASRRSTR